MESRNPVFSRSQGFAPGGYATFGGGTASAAGTARAADLEEMYARPSATSVQTGRMTLDDVVMRSAVLFGLLLVAAAGTYVARPSFGVVMLAMFAGLGLGLWISFSRTVRPPVMMVYAVVEGVFVGGISAAIEQAYSQSGHGGLVPQAVLGTLSAFAAMLVLYRTRLIRATPKFTKILIIAGFGYLAFGLLHLVGVWLHLWPSIYAGNGLLAVGASAFGVVLASLFLVLDFDFIEQGIRNGLPERYAWTAAFGLLVTLVWLYLEMLRLLAILRGND
jgi:uncharacterized YccA/Bax inhibitor family protein